MIYKYQDKLSKQDFNLLMDIYLTPISQLIKEAQAHWEKQDKEDLNKDIALFESILKTQSGKNHKKAKEILKELYNQRDHNEQESKQHRALRQGTETSPRTIGWGGDRAKEQG